MRLQDKVSLVMPEESKRVGFGIALRLGLLCQFQVELETLLSVAK